MRQTALRILIILLAAGVIAGGVYAFSITPAAQALAPARGNHSPSTDDGSAATQADIAAQPSNHDTRAAGGGGRRQGSDHDAHDEAGSWLDALLGIGKHLAQLALVFAVVVLLSKVRHAWRTYQKQRVASIGT